MHINIFEIEFRRLRELTFLVIAAPLRALSELPADIRMFVEGVGVLRLRRAMRFAHDVAPLRMTTF